MKIENLNLSSLKYFLDTVDSKSLTKAADMNFVSRPAISQAILRLEEWVGKKLITHEKKRFELTKEGQAFYRHAKESFYNFKKSIEAPTTDTGTLNIGCSSSLVDPYLLPIFRELKPIKSLHLVTGTTSHLKYRLEEKEINIAIYINDTIPSEAPGIELQSGRFVLASKSGDLTSQIITTEVRPEILSLKKTLLKKKLFNQSFLIVESWSLAAKLAEEFNSTCLIPDFFLNKNLKPVALKGFKEVYRVFLAHRNLEQVSLTEARFIELIQKYRKI